MPPKKRKRPTVHTESSPPNAMDITPTRPSSSRGVGGTPGPLTLGGFSTDKAPIQTSVEVRVAEPRAPLSFESPEIVDLMERSCLNCVGNGEACSWESKRHSTRVLNCDQCQVSKALCTGKIGALTRALPEDIAESHLSDILYLMQGFFRYEKMSQGQRKSHSSSCKNSCKELAEYADKTPDDPASNFASGAVLNFPPELVEVLREMSITQREQLGQTAALVNCLGGISSTLESLNKAFHRFLGAAPQTGEPDSVFGEAAEADDDDSIPPINPRFGAN